MTEPTGGAPAGRLLGLTGRRLLFVGAHPDDIELGCGALLHAVAPSAEVCCLTMSDNKSASPDGRLLTEHRASMAVLGVGEDRVVVESFPTRRFGESRQDILDRLLAAHRELMPDVVFTHSPNDIHQDHGVVTGETLRAFRGATVLGFEILRSTDGFRPALFFGVSEEDAEAKAGALAEYEMYRERRYVGEQAVRSGLVRYGTISDLGLAEAFEVLRFVT